MRFLHQNIQIGTNKRDELTLLCEELSPDLLILTENGYNDSNISLCKIENYVLANHYCRPNHKGGGLAIFIKNDINYKLIPCENAIEKHFETTGISVLTKLGKIIAVGIYRSPNGNLDTFFTQLESLLSDLTKNNQKFIIMGDFNIDVLDVNSPTTKYFFNLLNSFGLKWCINAPTRVTPTTETAIDNVISNIEDVTVSVINTTVADHYGQEAVILGFSPDREPAIAKINRDTKINNINLLNFQLAKENWDFLHHNSSVETKFEIFNKTFNFYLDTCCPIKRTKKPHLKKKTKWITKGILVSRERLCFLSEVSKNTNNLEFFTYFKSYKKIYRKIIQAAKAYDVVKSLISSKNISQTSWKIINENKNKSNKHGQIQIKVRDTLINDPLTVADSFNNFFSSIANKNGLCSFQKPAIVNDKNRPFASMALVPVSEEEVEKAIKQIPAKKSNDSNYVSPWLIKRCSKHILSPLTHLINLSFQSGIFPLSLKTAKVTPIFKKGDSSCQNNYRPISILPTFSKIFEKLFLAQIISFLEKYSLLSTNQFGFRKGKSTTEAVVRLVDMIVENIEDRKPTQGVFLDLSKAFDCVDHTILLQKLEQHGIRGLPQLWLKSFLSNRTQTVQIENQQSNKIELRYGVPQGSILSPLLFLVYVNDISSSLLHGKLFQYADDSTLCFSSNSKINLEVESFMDLNNCIQAFSLLNLEVNALKTNFINFCLRPVDSEFSPAVMLSDTLLEEVYSTKFLGIQIDKQLTWEDHINNVCSKISSGIYALRILSKYCPTQILIMAYYGLIYPHLSYGLILWGASSNLEFMRVFRLQKKAVRIIAKLKMRDSCKLAFENLKILTLPSLYIFETTQFCMSKCNLIRGSDIHTYDTRGRESYRIGRHRTVAYERLPSQAGVRFYNSLPNCIKNVTTPQVFKTKLKNALISKSFYSVVEFLEHRWMTS